MADNVFPKFIQEAITDAIVDGASLHYQSRCMPVFSTAELLDHFVAPADHHVGYRACEMNGNAAERVYWHHPFELESGWVSRITMTIQPDTASPAFLWPSKPTKEWPTRDYSPRMEEVWSWVEHREMVAKEWAIVEGVIKLFAKSGNTLSGIKWFWPDLDLLFKVSPGYNRNLKLVAWCKKWRELSRPRNMIAPINGVHQYLNHARSTVLSTQLMQRAEQDAPYHLKLSETSKRVKLPWEAPIWAPPVIEHRVP